MKKKTTLLVSLAGLAFLYAVPWICTERSLLALYQAMPGPQNPAEFADQYPFLDAMLWLLRMDIFSRGDPSVTAGHLSTAIRNICLLRHACISLSLALLCAAGLLARPVANRNTRAFARTLQVLLLGAVVVGLTQATLSFVRYERVVPYWDRTRDTNILNYEYRFGPINKDVYVPQSAEGIVLVRTESEDIHIAVDRRGRISVADALLTKSQLVQTVSAKAMQAPHPRFLLWVDRRCKPDTRNAVLACVTNVSQESIYFIFREDDSDDIDTVFKAMNHKVLHETR
jgi:biopolymer transport protein ExbD